MKTKMSNNTPGKRDLMEIAIRIIPSMSDEEMYNLAKTILSAVERINKEYEETQNGRSEDADKND